MSVKISMTETTSPALSMIGTYVCTMLTSRTAEKPEKVSVYNVLDIGLRRATSFSKVAFSRLLSPI